MRGNLLAIFDINQLLTATNHINGTIKTDKNYRGSQANELH